ncbi:MAG TPA: type IV secretion system protein [Steroidobacteraceae bacterium]|jgi:type IV secretion system protein VirB8|nr:type IV secretion system protein [Steroidobacteraceae bacterium]
MSADGALKDYLEEAASWDGDRMAQAARSAAVAWRVAMAGWLCAIASSAALALITPLKRVEPYLIRVDNSTGVVDAVPVYTGHAALGEAVARYFLTHYITVCERFDYAFAESDYEECGAFNSARLNQGMYTKWSRANPGSPLNVHKDGSTETVRIESVSFFKRTAGASDLAQVRFARIEHEGDTVTRRITHWIASIEYRYGKPPEDPRTRSWNPLGFEVLDIGIEPEVLGTARDSTGR